MIGMPVNFDKKKEFPRILIYSILYPISILFLLNVLNTNYLTSFIISLVVIIIFNLTLLMTWITVFYEKMIIKLYKINNSWDSFEWKSITNNENEIKKIFDHLIDKKVIRGQLNSFENLMLNKENSPKSGKLEYIYKGVKKSGDGPNMAAFFGFIDSINQKRILNQKETNKHKVLRFEKDIQNFVNHYFCIENGEEILLSDYFTNNLKKDIEKYHNEFKTILEH